MWIWCLFIAFVVPEVATLLFSLKDCVFKKVEKCSLRDFIVVSIFELLHILGQVILVFKVLPDLDVVKGSCLFNCVSIFPGKSLFHNFSEFISQQISTF